MSAILFSSDFRGPPDSYLGNFGEARANSALDLRTTLGLAKPFYEEVAALLESKTILIQFGVGWVLTVISDIIICWLLKTPHWRPKQSNKRNPRDYWSKILAIDPANATAKKGIGRHQIVNNFSCLSWQEEWRVILAPPFYTFCFSIGIFKKDYLHLRCTIILIPKMHYSNQKKKCYDYSRKSLIYLS